MNISPAELLERLVPVDRLDDQGLSLYASVASAENEFEARRAMAALLDRLSEQGYLRRLSSEQTADGACVRYRSLLTLDTVALTVPPERRARPSDETAPSATPELAPAEPTGTFLSKPFLEAVAASSRRTDLAGALGHLYDLLRDTIHYDKAAICMSKGLATSHVGNLLEFEDVCASVEEEQLSPKHLREKVEETGETLQIPDVKNDGRSSRHVPGGGGSLVIAALKAEAYVYGTLAVWSGRRHAFDLNAVGMVEFVAEFAAGLIKRRLEVEELIFIDQTCQIHNRRYFDEQLVREIERSKRTGNAVALLIGDLDNFKQVNDTLGHAAGDSVLRQVAGILAENARQVDIVARYGGEEFGIILPDVSRESALAVAQRARSAVDMHSFITGHEERPTWDLTISIGGALYPLDADSQVELLDRADRIALYEAKRRGKNRVVMYEGQSR